jgi:outer membrane protein assembly factor BamA
MLNFSRSVRRKTKLIASVLRNSCIVVIITTAAGSTTPGQQRAMKLAKIEIEGLQRLSSEQVIAVSELEIGQTVDVAAIDAASQRLMDSGLIKKLSYKLRPNGNQTTVTFKIEEARGGESLVIFDNFVWFTDEELAAAVRREVPFFNGTTAPDVGNITESITRALQLFLSEHKIAGKVEYMPASDNPGKQEHIFTVHGASIPICALHFPGAKNVDENHLIKSSEKLMGLDYSRRLAGLFATNNLYPIYREVGQLRATFGPPTASLGKETNCKDKVEVTIPVDEGAIYSWEKAEWSGNQALVNQELDTLLGMKPGEVANGLKFDEGMIAVRKGYGRKGFISTALRSNPEFDDAASKVTYRIAIKEGPQYHMGNLIIKGFPDSAAKMLRETWALKAGDVYDQGYPKEFFDKSLGEVMKKVIEESRAQGRKGVPKFQSRERPNRDTLTVDVTIELGS